MANEIQITATLSVAKNSIVASGSLAAALNLVTNNNYSQIVQTATSTGQAASIGTATYPLWMFIKNLDAANSVDIFSDGSTCLVTIGRIAPGLAFLWRASSAVGVKRATAATADVDIAVVSTEHD